MSLDVLYWVLVAVMMIGVIGTVVPGIPGGSLILAAILVWYAFAGFGTIGAPIIIVFLMLALSIAVEYFAAFWGARQFGASNWAQIGAIVGLILGVFGLLPALPLGGPILGVLIGPVLGGFIGEFLYRKELATKERLKQSLNASVGIVVGTLIGNVIEIALAIAAVVIFIFTTYSSMLQMS